MKWSWQSKDNRGNFENQFKDRIGRRLTLPGMELVKVEVSGNGIEGEVFPLAIVIKETVGEAHGRICLSGFYKKQ